MPTNDYLQRTIVDPNGTSRQVRVTIEYITPEIAAKYLSKNVEYNRKIQDNRLNSYMRDMRSSDWWFTGSNAIVFDEHGRLGDGQYRLTSIVKTGVPQTFIVVRGVSDKAMLAIDKGKSRSLLDSLKIEQNESTLCSSRMISLIKSVIKYGCGKYAIVTDSDIRKIYDAYSDELNTILRIFPSAEVGLGSATQAAFFAALLCGVSQTDMAKYLEVYRAWERSFEYNDDAAFNWKKQLINLKDKGGKATQELYYFGFQNSLYFFVTGKRYQKMKEKIHRYPVKDEIEKVIEEEK